MSAPVPAGWMAHEIVDGGRFQVLVRRTRRGGIFTPRVSPQTAALSAQNRSIAPGTLKVPGAIERTRANDFRGISGFSARGHKPPMGPPQFRGYDPDVGTARRRRRFDGPDLVWRPAVGTRHGHRPRRDRRRL